MTLSLTKNLPKLFLPKVLISGLLLSSNLYAGDNMELNNERDSQLRVVNHRGLLSLGGTEVSDRALNVYVQFPIRLLSAEILTRQLQQLPYNSSRLSSRDLQLVIDGDKTLENQTFLSSKQRAWNELESRLLSNNLSEENKAGLKLGLAKLIMGSKFEPSRFDQPVDCYNFVLSHLNQVIQNADSFEKRKVSHARIWFAHILVKKNLTLEGQDRAQTLQVAWDLLDQAYQDRATDATLFFMVEMIVRYGFLPHGGSYENALQTARGLLKQIGIRTELNKQSNGRKSTLERILSRASHDLSDRSRVKTRKDSDEWEMARAAFIKDIRKELNLISEELSGLEHQQEAKNGDFNNALLDDEGDFEDSVSPQDGDEIEIESALPPELSLVHHLIDFSSPEMQRAFDPVNGEYIFFKEYDVSGFQNNCSFNCMGMTRGEALESLLAHANDEIVRQLIAPQILASIIAHDVPESIRLLNLELSSQSRQQSGQQILRSFWLSQLVLDQANNMLERQEAQQKYDDAFQLLRQFIMHPETCKAFIRDALSGTKMLAYLRNDQDESLTSILCALAYIHHFNIEVWTRSDQDGLENQGAFNFFSHSNFTLQRVMNFMPENAIRTVRMRHMRVDVDGQNHFRFLVPCALPVSQTVGGDSSSMDEDQDDHSMEPIQVDFSDAPSLFKGGQDIVEMPQVDIVEDFEERDEKTTKEEIYRLHMQGMTKEQIAGICKVGCDFVGKTLENDFGVKKRKFRARMNDQQKKAVLESLGGVVKKSHLTSTTAIKMAARAAGCTKGQVNVFLRRELVGKPKELQENHKRFIRSIAFDKDGKRLSENSTGDIARRLNRKFQASFESYQVMNYIRSLTRSSTKYNF